MKQLVIYHANCWDGIAAAWAVCQNPEWAEAELLAAQYGDKAPHVLAKEVVIVDFSYPREVLLLMKRTSTSLQVLDHHKTAAESLNGLESFCTFDMEKSGCRLAWEAYVNRPIPNGLRYIEDRDLWLHAMPNCKKVMAWLRSHQKSFAILDRFMRMIDNPKQFDLISMEGAAILRNNRHMVDEACRHYREVKMGDFTGRVTNFSCGDLISDVAGALSSDANFGACWWMLDDGRIQWSLRSSTACDVSTIAKFFGGGGHKGAAGFSVIMDDHLNILKGGKMGIAF